MSLLGGMHLLTRPKLSNNISHLFSSFAAGSILSTVFFDLLPESVHEPTSETVGIGVPSGILFFFLFERFLHWSHHPSSD